MKSESKKPDYAQKRRRRIWALIIATILVAIGVSTIFTGGADNEAEQTVVDLDTITFSSETAMRNLVEIEGENIDLNRLEEYKSRGGYQYFAQLLDVTDAKDTGGMKTFGVASGDAHLGVFGDESIVYIETAKTPAPPEGKVYRGWMVDTARARYFALGQLQSIDVDAYGLIYTSNNDIEDFSHIVVTIDSFDGSTSDHILEGDLLR